MQRRPEKPSTNLTLNFLAMFNLNSSLLSAFMIKTFSKNPLSGVKSGKDCVPVIKIIFTLQKNPQLQVSMS